MSYRALKHLMGESHLQFKCVLYFGTIILVLITASFWFYSYLMEQLAYEQLNTTCRLLVAPVLAQQNLKGPRKDELDDFRSAWTKRLRDALGPDAVPNFQYRFLTQDTSDP